MSVIDTATNAVIATVPVGDFPMGVRVTPDGSGPAGSPVALYGVHAMPGLPYRLVLSRTQACADLVAFVNPTTVVPGPNGLIGTVRGTIPAATPAGTYWLCFRHTAGATATGVVSFAVN